MSDEGVGGTARWARGTICPGLVVLLLAAMSATAVADTVTLEPSKDNTLYEDDQGQLSNGEGMHLFAGRVADRNNGLIRRALLAFDVAGSVPAGSTITSATLRLSMSMTISGAHNVSLHRLVADWGEGGSVAVGGEGAGAPANEGDATWIHRFFSDELWASAGGDFDSPASAITSVGFPDEYSWGSTSEMVADVQGWLDEPQTNFGWILIGNEAALATAKRFASRENLLDPGPRLTVDFEPAGGTPTPSETPTADATPTATEPAPTPTDTPTGIATPTRTDTPTVTPTQASADTPTVTPTETFADPPTVTPTQTFADTPTATPTQPIFTPTATVATPESTETPTPGGRRCVGDCDADGLVALAEVVFAVQIGLGGAALSECENLDATGDGRADVSELIEAVDSSFDCIPACPLPNPAGCVQNACPPGFVCDVGVGCEPSSCNCDDETGAWSCTEDCGGGTCVTETE